MDIGGIVCERNGSVSRSVLEDGIRNSLKRIVNLTRIQTRQILSESPRLVIVERKTSPLTSRESDILTSYVSDGGRLLILLNERMDKQVLSSVNYFLENFGLSVCCLTE